MYICYNNAYKSGIWLVIGYYSPGCPDGGNFAKKGWWRLEPGQSATVLSTTNEYSYFYAEADDGEVWAGPWGSCLLHRCRRWRPRIDPLA
jgi:uncharacterized membrane protein